MTIKMRLSSILAASVLAATAGLATGLAAAPAGANPGGGPLEECQQAPCVPPGPDHGGPDGFEVCTEDCSSHPVDPGEPPVIDPEEVDVPIPANANFTG